MDPGRELGVRSQGSPCLWSGLSDWFLPGMLWGGRARGKKGLWAKRSREPQVGGFGVSGQPSHSRVWNSEMWTSLQGKGLWLLAFWVLVEVEVGPPIIHGSASLLGLRIFQGQGSSVTLSLPCHSIATKDCPFPTCTRFDIS